ncbi:MULTISPECIES: fibronectin type III domain-containing protein [unclassified Myxococcus]|uniref:fibronectin type III domain-containing protein n=2 Tax=Myxococcaceae TaxID=31 RepID=UPI001E5D5431|nr:MULTISPECIES: fibronectin type III domain-containing protein [unclassified Myxococcus]
MYRLGLACVSMCLVLSGCADNGPDVTNELKDNPPPASPNGIPGEGGSWTGQPTGGDHAPGEMDDVDSTDVIITHTERFYTSVGIAVRSKDLSSNPPELLVRTRTGFTRYTGAPSSEGYHFPSVPQGEYYLKTGSAYVVTDERRVEIGRHYLGRQDAVATSHYLTPAYLNLTNLAPWQASAGYSGGSRLQIVSGQVDLSAEVFINDYVAAGQTQLDAQDAQAYGLSGNFPVFEAAKGDRLYVNQLTNVFGAPLPNGEPLVASALVRSAQLPALNFTADGVTPLVIIGAMQDVPMTDVSFEWRLGNYASVATEIHPAATARMPTFYIEPSAHGPQEGWVGYSGELFSLLLPPGTSHTIADRLPYGNPYPSSWRPVGTATYQYRILEPLPGDTTITRSVTGSLLTSDYVENLVASPITPALTPPRALSIDGIPATSQRVVGNTSPIITWQPPANGAPTAYRVSLIRYVNTSASTQTTLYLPGTATEVRLPVGTLAPDAIYSVKVTALDSPHQEVTREPFTIFEKLPLHTADTISSLFTTP